MTTSEELNDIIGRLEAWQHARPVPNEAQGRINRIKTELLKIVDEIAELENGTEMRVCNDCGEEISELEYEKGNGYCEGCSAD